MRKNRAFTDVSLSGHRLLYAYHVVSKNFLVERLSAAYVILLSFGTAGFRLNMEERISPEFVASY
jgi:hypothetical protein